MTTQNENVQPEEFKDEAIQTAEDIQQEAQTETEYVVEEIESELDPLNSAYAKIAELEAYIAETDKREQEIQLRAQAEIQNIRRRTEQDVEKAHKFALEKFSKELLNVVDNLERGLDALDNAVTDETTQALVDGVEMTHKEFINTLAKFGVLAMGEVGEAFNPELHEAISMQPAEGVEANHISSVLQKGYTLHGRVIRPAMVMVAA